MSFLGLVPEFVILRRGSILQRGLASPSSVRPGPQPADIVGLPTAGAAFVAGATARVGMPDDSAGVPGWIAFFLGPSRESCDMAAMAGP